MAYYGTYSCLPSTPAPSSPQIAGAAVAGSSATGALSGGSGSSAAQADWTSRSSAPGVIWAQRFASLTDVQRFLCASNQAQAQATNVFVSNDGIFGDGCMSQLTPAGDVNHGSWGRPIQPIPGDINNAGLALGPTINNGTDATNQLTNMKNGHFGHSDYWSTFPGQYVGTEYWLQFRVKFSSNRFDAAEPSGKMLNCQVSFQGTPGQEYVLNTLTSWGGGWYRAYTNGGNAFNSFLTDPQGGNTGNSIQPLSPYASTCVIGQANLGEAFTNCWCYTPGGWDTILLHVRLGHQAADLTSLTAPANAPAKDTLIEVFGAHAGETNYTLIYRKPDLIWDFSGSLYQDGTVQANGQNWLSFTAFNGGSTQTPSVNGYYHRYDQIICSTQPIPCPRDTAGAAPAWFAALSDSAWTAVAGGPAYGAAYQNGARLDSQDPGSGAWSSAAFSAIITDFVGGSASQLHGELLLIDGGGHASRQGNDGYACAIRQAVPAWSRLSNPSGAIPSQVNSALSDGTPVAEHTWGNVTCDKNGRVWFIGIHADFDDNTYNVGWRYDRAALTGQTLPVAPTFSGLWKNLGAPYDTVNSATGFSVKNSWMAYDKVGHRSYLLPYQDVNNRAIWRFDLSYGGSSMLADGASAFFPVSTGNSLFFKWGVVAHDLGILIAMTRSDSPSHPNTICCLELSTLNAASRWYFGAASGTGTANTTDSQFGVVYYAHASTRHLYLWNDGMGQGVQKLTVPATPLTSASSDWAWSTVTGSGLTPTARSNAGTYGRFNIIEDMGNGQAALVVATGTQDPVWVLKVPLGGL